MPVRAIVPKEEIDSLDEALKALYKEDKDVFVLDLDATVDDHPRVKGLKATLGRYREIAPDAKGLKAKIDEAERIRQSFDGLDPEEMRAALTRLQEIEDGTQDKDVEKRLEATRLDLEKKHGKVLGEKDKAITERDQKILSMDAFIRKLLIDNGLDAAIEEIEVLPEYKKAVKALLKEYGPKVVDEDGEYTSIYSTDLGDISLKDFVKKWATEDEAAPYLKPSGNRGTGARDSAGGGARKNPWAAGQENLTEQGRMLKENPTLARTLAAAAGKKIA